MRSYRIVRYTKNEKPYGKYHVEEQTEDEGKYCIFTYTETLNSFWTFRAAKRFLDKLQAKNMIKHGEKVYHVEKDRPY